MLPALERGRVRLSRGRLFAYALPAMPIAALGLPLAVHMPPFYAGTLGLGLSIVGAVFLLARLWDVVTDPVLGLLSDHFDTRWGRRRHWIVLSLPIVLLSVAMVFIPQGAVSGAYLLFWLFVLYIGWTLLNISHLSWGAELSPDYHERSQVQGAREVALILGVVLVLMLPVILDWIGPDDSAMARAAAMGWFVIILLPLAVALAVIRVPERETPPPVYVPMGRAVSALIQSRPLRRVLAADLITGISGGLGASMFLFLVEDVLQLRRVSSLLLLCYFLSGICFVPLMLYFARRLGKHRAAALAALFNSAAIPLVLFVPAGNVLFAMLVWAFLGVNMAAGPFLFRAIMADVADHDTVLTGRERTGLFFAMLTSTNKIGMALAIGLGYMALDAIGFNPGGDNPQAVLDRVRTVFVLPSLVFGVMVAWILWYFPLDEQAQRRNRKIIEARRTDGRAIWQEGAGES